jgi:hypothetical protein
VTPTPAAIERLSSETFPEGVALSAATAVIAYAMTKKNRASFETARTLNMMTSSLRQQNLKTP